MAKRNFWVLVADDQQNTRTTLRGLIEGQGGGAVEAEDGYQAIDAAKRGAFDLALIDIEMPGINGIQTLRELRKLQPDLRVVMVTCRRKSPLAQLAVKEGAVSVLYKPVEASAVARLVRFAASGQPSSNSGSPKTEPASKSQSVGKRLSRGLALGPRYRRSPERSPLSGDAASGPVMPGRARQGG